MAVLESLQPEADLFYANIIHRVAHHSYIDLHRLHSPVYCGDSSDCESMGS